MSTSDDGIRHGRRARRLTPEEQAARASAATTSQQTAIPAVRGAVAAPGADAPVPALRKFGKRARIIELVEPEELSAAAVGPAADPAADPATASRGDGPVEPVVDASADAEPVDADRTDHAASADVAASPVSSGSPAASAAASPVAPSSPDARSTAPARTAIAVDDPEIRRDSDGVELGEMSVSDAPSPKPAPRFEGNVLHRPERAGGRPLLWLVWAVVAIAIIALIVLLVTGVLGPASANAAVPSASDLSSFARPAPFLEELLP